MEIISYTLTCTVLLACVHSTASVSPPAAQQIATAHCVLPSLSFIHTPRFSSFSRCPASLYCTLIHTCFLLSSTHQLNDSISVHVSVDGFAYSPNSFRSLVVAQIAVKSSVVHLLFASCNAFIAVYALHTNIAPPSE